MDSAGVAFWNVNKSSLTPKSTNKSSLTPKSTINHALLAGNLPDIHKGPFDRMLIAQAIIERLILITRDKLIGEYEVQTLMA